MVNSTSGVRLLAVVVVAALLFGCGDDGAPPTTLADAQLRAGQDVYAARCSMCHGSDGRGGVGPALGNGVVVTRIPDVAEHRRVVVEGRNGMPSFATVLSDEEIDAVVRYEREALGR